MERRDLSKDAGIAAQEVLLSSQSSKPEPRTVVWGLVLTGLIAAAARTAHRLPIAAMLNPMIIATGMGMLIGNTVGRPDYAQPGVVFATRRLLRLGIVLLGFQITFSQIASLGAAGLVVVVMSLGATFAFTLCLGGLLGVESGLCQLIAAGTSICGASAVVAVNTVSGASDEDVTYAVGCVTLFGTIAMFCYPVVAQLLRLAPRAYGLWSGASIHEIAQVIGAAFQGGVVAGEVGAIAKLTRVILLAPLIFGLGGLARWRRAAGAGENRAARPATPWFVLVFLVAASVNTWVSIPVVVRGVISNLTAFLLCMALCGMGLETDLRKIRAMGYKPLMLGAAAWLFIAAFSFSLIQVLGP
jgi:uncharacterized integral membrane protein (TIGR00698 family)